MATVHLPSDLTQLTRGTVDVEIDATRVHDALQILVAKFPQLAEPISELAVAVDGEIYTEPGYQPLRTNSELYFVPRIAGG